MGYLYGILAVIIKVFLFMIRDKDMAKCFGLMAMYIVANGSRESNMAKVSCS
jgi:hypothetical protein